MTTRAIKRASIAVLALALAASPLVGGAADATRAFLEARIKQDPLDFTAQNRLSAVYIGQLRETGDLAYLDLAAQAAKASLAAVPAPPNVGGLAALAITEFENHHFNEALQLSSQAYQLDPRNLSALATSGDAQLELGNVDEARQLYEKLAAEQPGSPKHRSPKHVLETSLPVLARLARLAELHGDLPQAKQLLERGGNDVWFKIRLGELAFHAGDFKTADQYYQAALSLKPQHFVALEHLAELAAAQGQYDEAIKRYQQVIAQTPRAEFFQALGDVYAFMGKPELAKPWHEKALAVYQQSVVAGNAHYLHHLAGFYSDSQENAEQAVRWARQDLTIRHSIYAYDALAWALYKHGDFAEARDTIAKALVLKTRDAHLLYHAGLIYSRAGDLQQGRQFLQQTVAINPSYNAFHAHR